MGNAELCGGPTSGEIENFNRTLILEGKIINSQTRALMAILKSSMIQFQFKNIDEPLKPQAQG